MTVMFIVQGEPMSKARPRHGKGRTYTPTATLIAETAVLAAFLKTPSRRKIAGDLKVTIQFHCATKVRRDLDNMAKLALDALNGHAYDDDSQVQHLTVSRTFVARGQAFTAITITPLETP